MASNWRFVVSDVATDPEANYGFEIQQFSGAGMPPINNISTDFGLLDGGIFQRQRAGVRTMSLTGIINGSSVTDLHTKRKALINAVKPDRSASQQPMVIQYTGGASTLQASAFYDEGLSLGTVDVYREAIGLRFLMYDPYWEKTTSSSATLTVQTTVACANYILQKSASGAWGALDTGLRNVLGGAGRVTSLLTASGTNLFVTGLFSSASSTTTCFVGKWTGTSWTNIASGINGVPEILAKDSTDTTVYMGGIFTTLNGSAVNSFVQLRGSVWSQPVTSCGPNNTVRAILPATTGDIYIGGDFSAVSALSACSIAKLSGSTYTSLSTGLYSTLGGGVAYDLAEGIDGNIYAVGTFNTAGGTSACGFAKWNGTTWSVGVASGASGTCYALVNGNDGTIYIGGESTTVFPGSTASRVAKTNRVIWEPLGGGVNGRVSKLFYSASINTLFAGGNFTTAGSIPVTSGAFWNGSIWFPLDVNLPSSGSIGAIDYTNGKLTIGFGASGTASAAAVTTVTTAGTANIYPIFTASAPTSTSTRLYQLINYTTGDAIYFNLVLQPSEVVTLDLNKGKKSFTSTYRGNIISTILPGSNVTTWHLASGNNVISCWLTGGSGAAKLTWYDRFWSIDN